MQNGDRITGQAIVNYAKGAPEDREWPATVNLRGDLDAAIYTFYVSLDGADQTAICTFTVRENGGRQGCTGNVPLPGFNTATVREGDMDSNGEIVATGTFTRRGGQRTQP